MNHMEMKKKAMESHPKGKPLTPDGMEIVDPTPMAPPVGYKRQPSLAEQIREMVRSERLRSEVEAQGQETFEEADDFDVGDDYDPTSPYEADFDPIPEPERAALRSQGKDVDAILGPPPKPKKKKTASDDQSDDVIEADNSASSGEPE